ncbi:MAG: O-methyltransferase [Gloeobacteraceae cyanobacterium ES-bin-316]|nr:O-methyltransferase [Ferruginibacter sp.]
MQLVNEKAELYAIAYSSTPDILQQRVEAHTQAHHPHAHMISGSVQGRFLSFFSQILKPEKILEIGTFTGFSALCLAAGLKPGGMLHTIELREEDAATANQYFQQSLYAKSIQLHQGDALQIIPTLEEQWDLVFLDADKVNYINYYELTLPKLKRGGWIIADNVLFHGQVLEDEIKGKSAIAIQAFNDHVKNDDRVEQVLLTVRDGLMLIKKI